MGTYTIEVTRTVTETYRETFTVRAGSLDEAEQVASDRLTRKICAGGCDLHQTEVDTHEVVATRA